MTNRSLAQVVLRVWGLVWILSAAGSILQLASLVLRPAPPGGTGGYLRMAFVSVAMTGVVAPLLLLFGSNRIAAWLFPAEAKIELEGPARALLPVLFAAVGISFVLYALPALVAPVFPSAGAVRGVPMGRSGRPLGAGIQFLAGIALFLGAGPLGRLWSRLNPDEPRKSGKD